MKKEAAIGVEKKKKINIATNISGWLLLVPSILAFTIVVWRPIIVAITDSMFTLQGVNRIEFVGLKNYIDVITDTNFLQALWNTVKYVLWSLLIGLPLPFVTAVMLNEMRYSKDIFNVTYYMPCVIPAVATYLFWTLIYADGPGGLLNTILYQFGIEPQRWLTNPDLTIVLIIITMTWSAWGSSIIYYLSSLQGVDQSLYEAARLDGAGIFQRIKVVMMPNMYGILLLTAVRQIISVFQVTEQPLMMTGGGPNGASMSLGLTNYFYAFKFGQFDKSMALGFITFILLMGLTLVYFKLDKKIND